jgi:hypothetical protein
VVREGISPGYFLDEMSFGEIAAIVNANDNRRREEWEKVRQICFYSIAGYTDKVKSPQDLFKLPWDRKNEKKVSKLTKEQAREEAKKIEKWLDKKK